MQRDLIFEVVHKIGNSAFALETNLETLFKRLGDQEPELQRDIRQNLATLNERIGTIKDLENTEGTSQ